MKCRYFSYPVIFLVHISLVMARHSHNHHHHRQHSEKCVQCPEGFGVISHCNRHHDTKCEPCPKGYYSSHSSAHRPCFTCSRCGVGLFVAHKCTPTSDTVCDSCHTYKRPHNDDFFKKCVLPLLEDAKDIPQQNNHTQMSPTIIKEPAKAANVSQVQLALIILSVTTAALLFAYVVFMRKYHCSKLKARFPYQAVATNEAVML